MELQIIFTDDVRKYEAIYTQIKEKIITGQLQANDKLPSKRKLALHLHVSIQTIQIAYEQLVSEGYIYSQERAGYFISPFNSDWQLNEATSVQFDRATVQPTLHNLRNGQVEEDAFPYTIWLKLYRKQLLAHPMTNSSWQGEESLRNEIARYIQVARGIRCQPSQIFIYSGTQQQLQALSNFFRKVPVAMEEPGFYRANIVFAQNKHPIEYVPVDENGAAIPKKRCQLYYVTPAHQYPLGYIMPLERKMQLLQWAKESNTYIIEDDYDAEFRYKGMPIPPLAQLDQLQQVIYFGTFSKTLIPSLRVSYLILPLSLVGAFESFHHDNKSTVSKIDQLVIADFMADGHYARHIDKMRTLYRKKRLALLKSLQTHLTKEFSIIGDAAGLHVIIHLPKWLSEAEAIQRALHAGIAIDPISRCYQMSPSSNSVIVGFGAAPLDQIPKLIEKLANSWLSAKLKAT